MSFSYRGLWPRRPQGVGPAEKGLLTHCCGPYPPPNGGEQKKDTSPAEAQQAKPGGEGGDAADGEGDKFQYETLPGNPLSSFFCGVGSSHNTVERRTSRSVIDILPQHVNNLRGSGKDDGEVVQQPSW